MDGNLPMGMGTQHRQPSINYMDGKEEVTMVSHIIGVPTSLPRLLTS